LFGQDFENYEKVVAQMAAKEAEEREKEEKELQAATGEVDVEKFKAKKGKLLAKSGTQTYQFQILEAVGVPRTEVKKFADPYYWLKYFPPIAIVS
jgi:leucyl-tRNA synthetase